MKGVQKILKVPETFRGMKKVKEYPNHVLYIDEYGRRECFQYYDLGFNTKQIKMAKAVHIKLF